MRLRQIRGLRSVIATDEGVIVTDEGATVTDGIHSQGLG